MMKTVLIFALAIGVVCAGDVLDLTKATFDSSLKDLDLALVEFYAPWCGHCKKLTPEYEKAATELKSSDPPVTLARVDCTVETDLATKYGVSGYPTLKIFRKGEVSAPYEGPRTADGIVKYMQKQSAPAARVLATVAEAEKFVNNKDYSVVGFFETEGGALFAAFKALADGNRDDFRFAYTTSDEVTAKLGGKKGSVFVLQPKVLQSKFEEKAAKFDGESTVANLKTFVTEKTVGLVPVLTPDNEKFVTKRPLVVIFFDLDLVKDPSGAKYIRNRVLKLASETKTGVNFAVANTADFPQYQQSLALKTGEARAVILNDSDKFRQDSTFTIDGLPKFIEDFKAGKLESYIKSEPIPEDSGPVKVVVGKNFKQVVEESDKDVLLEFYAPWCGHCKSLAPKWDELATKLSGDDNIIVAKIDATANDYPSKYPVRGYPSIFFIPKNDKGNPKKYEGNREVADFITYLKANASQKPKIKDEL